MAELLPFTAHNILLPDGSRTIPGQILLEDDPGFLSLRRAVAAFAPAGGDRKPTVLDLGCLEGGYAALLAREGYDVLGIEVRQESFRRCELLASKLGVPSLRFAHDDARNLSRYGSFDIVLCLGLLYHLDRPRAFLQELGRATTRVLVVNTHYAAEEGCSNFALSEITENEGLSGRWYEEYPAGASADEIERRTWASHGNPRSFWPMKGDLLGAIQQAGFPSIFEQYDILGPVGEFLRHEKDYCRGQFLAIKESRPARG